VFHEIIEIGFDFRRLFGFLVVLFFITIQRGGSKYQPAGGGASQGLKKRAAVDSEEIIHINWFVTVIHSASN